MNNHKQVRRILSNCPSCHIDIFIASYQHVCCQAEKPFPPSDYFNMSSTGQWSLPKISLCMRASHMRSFILSDMRK